jgi:hypothetical protein
MTRIRLLALLLLPLLLLACGGDEEADAQPAGEILTASAKAVQGVTSFHFKLTHENGTTPMPLNLRLVSAEGDVQAPDRLKAEVRASASSLSVVLEVIGIGNEAWATNPFTRRWQALPSGTTIQDVADPAGLVTSILTSLQEPMTAGRTELDGVQTVRVTGKMDSGAMQNVLPAVQPGLPVTVDLWLGLEDGLPRRARVSGQLAQDEPENIVRQIDLSRFNSRVDIQPPQV